MSELKAYRPRELVMQGRHNEPIYLKSEVDAAITELKARIHELESIPHTDNSAVIERLSNENERLKAKLESVQATDYTESVDAGMENYMLKRALWLMTAEWAEAMGLASCNIANKFMSRENFEVGDDYRNETIKKYRHRQVVFYKYADYCRNKAE